MSFSEAVAPPVASVQSDLAPVSWRSLFIMLAIPSLLALWVIRYVPFTSPQGYLELSEEYVTTGHIQQTFFAAGYPWIVALGLKLDGIRGLELEQAVIYVGLALAVWNCLRIMGSSAKLALIASLAIVLYPDLPDTVAKCWDVDVSCLTFVLTVWVAATILVRGLALWRVVLLGVLWGWGLTVRPNTLLLFPAFVFVVWKAVPYRSGGNLAGIEEAGPRSRYARWTSVVLCSLLCMTLGGATVAGINTAIHGRFYWPGNGPYNLYQGHNPYSMSGLLTTMGGEPLLYQAFRDEHQDLRYFNSPAMNGFYVSRSVAFARSHPGEELELCAVKLFTILRPNTRSHPLFSPIGLFKTISALPVPFWIFTLIWLRKDRTDSIDWLVVLVAVLYVLPFVLTIADPRYRVPLDVLVLVHTVRLWGRFRGRVHRISEAAHPARLART